MIYGLGILAACFLTGQFLGEALGAILGVNANVGGVAFAMILLLIACSKLPSLGQKTSAQSRAVLFWQNLYIPVCVAMAACQDMATALSSGWIAIVGGIAVTVAGFLLLPLLSKLTA